MPPSAQAIRNACSAHLTETLSHLQEWVAINSFTRNRRGVEEVGRQTALAFAPLGFRAETVPSENPDFGDHLVLTRPGKSERTVAWVSHLDTVFPADEEAANDFGWREEDGRIHGPGTFDVKGGTALVYQTLSALRDVAPDCLEAVTWRFLLNSSEEALAADFGRLCRERIPKDALAALVVEGGARAGDSHALVTARKGRAVFRVRAFGRAAHAGGLHARGANAIAQLAHSVGRLEALTNHDAGLTVNVGVLSGGTLVNRVPHEAEAEVEMRAFAKEVFERAVDDIHGVASDISVRSLEDGKACELAIETTSKAPPWPRDPGTESLFQTWRSAGEDLGLRLMRQERGGLSDANLIWDHVPTVDGLGPCGDNAHCSQRRPDGSMDQEYVERDSFVPRAALNCVALLKLIR